MYLRVETRHRAKNKAVERLTDKTRETEQRRDEIELSEGWEHRLWRRMPWSQPMLEVTALEDKAYVIEEWRKEVTEEDVERDEHRARMIRKLAAARRAADDGRRSASAPHAAPRRTKSAPGVFQCRRAAHCSTDRRAPQPGALRRCSSVLTRTSLAAERVLTPVLPAFQRRWAS